MAAWPELKIEELFERLTQRRVDFVVIGGIAAVLLGSPRLTRDLDICVSTEPANLDALERVLVELEARLRDAPDDVPFVPDGRALRQVELLTLVTSAGWLDLVVRPKGAPVYERLRRNAERIDVGGQTVLVASIDDLIAMKLAAGRPKDLADVDELETIQRLREEASRKS